MSKAYYFVKNFSWSEVSNLLCYGTKHPNVLSHQQKVTRLYRATLRRVYAHQVEGYKIDFNKYNQNITTIGKEFKSMIALKPESLELRDLYKKYEDLQEELFDPAMIIDESRPYAASSGRYYIFDDYLLKFDPFGYYSPKLLSENRPEESMPFYEDYPQNDSHWNLWEQFPNDFEDADHERQTILKHDKN